MNYWIEVTSPKTLDLIKNDSILSLNGSVCVFKKDTSKRPFKFEVIHEGNLFDLTNMFDRYTICALVSSDDKEPRELEGLTHENSCIRCYHEIFLQMIAGPHVGIYCARCLKYQRWAQMDPHFDNYVYPIGKHKGKTLSEIPRSYLIWAEQNIKQKSLVRAIGSYLTIVKEAERKIGNSQTGC